VAAGGIGDAPSDGVDVRREPAQDAIGLAVDLTDRARRK
jgi:hypothetical protein